MRNVVKNQPPPPLEEITVLNSSKGVLEVQGVLNSCCDLELRGIDVFGSHGGEGPCSRSGKSKASIIDGGSNLSGKIFELPEFHNVVKDSRLKKKRFGSLNEIHEKGLSEADRRKRDRIKKRIKKKGFSEETIELEGCSITEFDMQARRNYLLVKATKTLEVGKKVGIEFIEDENEVVEDLILIAEKELEHKEV
ncbi:hypothetical protein GQ457_13G004030 [Hibiscus cannabinus]